MSQRQGWVLQNVLEDNQRTKYSVLGLEEAWPSRWHCLQHWCSSTV